MRSIINTGGEKSSKMNKLHTCLPVKYTDKDKMYEKLLGLILITSFISFTAKAQISNAQYMFLIIFRLIKWPEMPQGNFIFGVVGNMEVYDNLVQITNGKKWACRTLQLNILK